MLLFVLLYIIIYTRRVQVPITSEEDIVKLFNKGDRQAFQYVYRKYYKLMFRYSCSIVNEAEAADEIVQNVFLRILEKNGTITISRNSLAAYLLRSVRNQSMNYINRRKFEREYLERRNAGETVASILPSGRLEEKELEREYIEALNELPEQCRTVFQLSRSEELTYKEIAGKLNISVKTVETQMGRALRKLRIKLAEFLVLVMILIWLIE
ncbi:RNA polymerase sigma-70 factor (ECF subfamily) [Arcticibacter tournemirensis]|nr:RNA polymerase sigma-70 factor (ECF subfamily) [Arcticibacter tournemirensis]